MSEVSSKSRATKRSTVSGKIIEVNVIEVLARRNAEPKLQARVVECASDLVEQFCDVGFVCGIDLLPIDHHTSSFGRVQFGHQPINEAIPPIRRAMGQIFNRLRLPNVADQVAEQRHKGKTFTRGEFRRGGYRRRPANCRAHRRAKTIPGKRGSAGFHDAQAIDNCQGSPLV